MWLCVQAYEGTKETCDIPSTCALLYMRCPVTGPSTIAVHGPIAVHVSIFFAPFLTIILPHSGPLWQPTTRSSPHSYNGLSLIKEMARRSMSCYGRKFFSFVHKVLHKKTFQLKFTQEYWLFNQLQRNSSQNFFLLYVWSHQKRGKEKSLRTVQRCQVVRFSLSLSLSLSLVCPVSLRALSLLQR